MKTIGIVRSGMMGCGIAQHSAQSGYRVMLWDANPDGLNSAVQRQQAIWQALYDKNKFGYNSGNLTDADRYSRIGGRLRLRVGGGVRDRNRENGCQAGSLQKPF